MNTVKNTDLHKLIEKTKESCEGSGNAISEREILDDQLSRYACHLIAMNGSPQKKLSHLPNLFRRENSTTGTHGGRIPTIDGRPKEVYNPSLTFLTIAGIKGSSKKILDHMGGTELAANLFRITQTDEKLRREIKSRLQLADETDLE